MFSNLPAFVSDSAAFMDYALDSVLRILNAHAGSVFLWNEAKKALVLKCARGPYRERVRDRSVRLSEGVSGVVGEKGHCVLVKDIQEDERFQNLFKPGHYDTYSFISVPVIYNNRLLGVINITEKSDFTPFSEEDLDLAKSVTHHIAVAYEHMRLSERLKGENAELHERVTDLEKSVRVQEPLVTIGKLAANLAHELNNPLDSIRRYVNLALDQAPEESLSREYLLKAKSGIRRAVRVIRGLLQFFRVTTSTKEALSEIHAVIDSTLDAVSQDENYDDIEIEKQYQDGSLWVADHGLDVVFRNLFKNAHHAMACRGKLTLSTRLENAHVLVTVADTGCGIPDAVKQRLFEPFFSTKKEEGTGIGLTICKQVVEKSGGTIDVASEAGKGTQFVIALPVKKAAPANLK